MKEHTSEILHSVGWQLVLEDDFAVFVHKPTGLFLEIPKYSEDQLSKNSEPVDKLRITFSNGSEELYYEVWFLKTLLAKGFAKPDADVIILVNSEKLVVHAMYTVDGKYDEYKMDASNLLIVELLVFSIGTSERNPDWEPDGHIPALKTPGPNKTSEEGKQFGSLISRSFIRVHKGFRVARTGAGKGFAFLDRLVVGGIERILSYSKAAMLYLDEGFGDCRDRQDNVINTGTPLFAHASLVIDSNAIKEVITQFRVTSTVVEVTETKDSRSNRPSTIARRKSIHGIIHKHTGAHGDLDSLSGEKISMRSTGNLDESDLASITKSYAPGDRVAVEKVNVTFGESVSDLITTKVQHTHMIDSITGIEKIELRRPDVTNKRPTSDTSRSFELKAERLFHSRGKIENRVIGDAINLSAHTALGSISRARATHLSPRSLYPYEVFSSRYTIVCSVVEPVEEETGQGFNENGEPFPSDSVLNTYKLGSAIDKVMLGASKSRHEEIPSTDLFFGQWYFVCDNYDLHIISSEVPSIGCFSRGFHDNEIDQEREFAENAALDRVVVSSAPCTDIQFTCHGFHAKLEDNTDLHCANGFAASTKVKINVTDRAVKKYRTFDFDGDRVKMLEASPRMLAIFSRKLRSDILQRIKASFERLLLNKQQALQAEKVKEAGQMVAAFEEKIESEMSRSGASKMNSTQLKDQMRVLKEAERIRSSVQAKKSPADIFINVVECVYAFDAEEEKYRQADVSPATGPENTANAPQTSKNHRGERRLLFSQLVKYMISVTLPGFETPMTKPEVNCALRSIENESIPGYGSVIPKDAFVKWYTTTEAADSLESLTPKSLYPLLLEEFVSCQRAYKPDVEMETVVTKDVYTGELLKRTQRKGVTKRMSIIWNMLSNKRDREGSNFFQNDEANLFNRDEFGTGYDGDSVGSTIHSKHGLIRRASMRMGSLLSRKIDHTREHDILSQADTDNDDNTAMSGARSLNSDSVSVPPIETDDVAMHVVRTVAAGNRSGSRTEVKHALITPEGSEASSGYSTDEEGPKKLGNMKLLGARFDRQIAQHEYVDEGNVTESDGDIGSESDGSSASPDAFSSDTESSDDEMRL